MKVEVLYFDGCPNHDALVPHLRKLLGAAETGADIDMVRVEDADAAERERFLGSPTVRIDGTGPEGGSADMAGGIRLPELRRLLDEGWDGL